MKPRHMTIVMVLACAVMLLETPTIVDQSGSVLPWFCVPIMVIITAIHASID